MFVRSGFLRRRDLLEFESAESSFDVMLWLGEGTGTAAAGAAGDVEGARSNGGLSVLLVAEVVAASGVTSGGVDGTFAEINGKDLAAPGGSGGGGADWWPPPSRAAEEDDDAGGLRLRVGLWPGGTGVCRDKSEVEVENLIPYLFLIYPLVSISIFT